MTATAGMTLETAPKDRGFWGRLVESAVGAHLANEAGRGTEVLYWRERNREVDFVLRRGRTLIAIEFKSGRRRDALLAAFSDEFKPQRSLLVGGDGIPLEDFLSRPVETWLRR